MNTKDICPDCGGKISVRNPTGKCDHLYYPDNKPMNPNEVNPYQDIKVRLNFETGEILLLSPKNKIIENWIQERLHSRPQPQASIDPTSIYSPHKNYNQSQASGEWETMKLVKAIRKMQVSVIDKSGKYSKPKTLSLQSCLQIARLVKSKHLSPKSLSVEEIEKILKENGVYETLITKCSDVEKGRHELATAIKQKLEGK